MGCFLGCFGSSKDRKRKQKYKVVPRDQNRRIQNLVKADACLEENIKEKPSNPVPESRCRGATEEPLSLKSRKRVTFDANVTTYEHIQVSDSTESLLHKNEKGETFPKSAQTQSQLDANSKDNSLVSRTSSYRYGNYLESEDEVEDPDYEHTGMYEDDDDDDDMEEEEDYDDDVEHNRIKQESEVESLSMNTVGSNRNARYRSGYVLSVLNPIENLTQWEALKSKGATRKPLDFNRQKENSLVNSKPPELKNQNQETAVDASLSNWLISSG